MIPIARNIKRHFSFKELAVVLLAIIISVSAGVGVFLYLKRDVAIEADGQLYHVKTMKNTVKEVLDQSGISVSPDDYINLPLNQPLQRMKLNKINIKRAVPVYITVDGKEIKVMTYKDTVSEVLTDSSVKLAESDRLDGYTLKDSITEGMKMNVVRVNEQTISEKIAVPFKTEKKSNSKMDQGKERVVKEGKEGLREKLYRVVYENGKEIARELIKDAIVQNPVTKVIEYGTVLNHQTSRGETLRYKKVLNMRATAYTASYEDTGKRPGHPQFGITSTGVRAKKGIIAVDPKVIPLGTRMYIEVAGKTPDYGYAIAGDTGGAIKGDLIDLYFDDIKTVRNWGYKRVKVYILQD